MSKFLLTDWEINGYNDSDFMCSYYDDVGNIIGFYEYGTTRFVAPTNIGINPDGTTSVVIKGDVLRLPSVEIVEKARLCLEERIFDMLVDADKRLVDQPDVPDLRDGMRVRLLEKAKMQLREFSPCQKCGGGGKWVNPKNPNDKRDCFGCKGTGKHVGAKVKGDNGKQAYKELPAGLSGEVIDWSSFGQFYASGYNKPNRSNTSVQFRTDAGEVVRASLSKLRLDRDYKPANEQRESAKRMSFGYGFSALFPKHAWDTRNFAAEIVKSAT